MLGLPTPQGVGIAPATKQWLVGASACLGLLVSLKHLLTVRVALVLLMLSTASHDSLQKASDDGVQLSQFVH